MSLIRRDVILIKVEAWEKRMIRPGKGEAVIDL